MVMLDQSILRRYRAVTRFNGEPEQWNRQIEYGEKFPYQFHHLTDEDLAGMLMCAYWLGSRAPADGTTDRIAIDIDCKSPEQLDQRTAIYWRIRNLFGRERLPLVYTTPSGRGLRVVYRIPRIPLTEVITGTDSGLVAEVLRGAEIEVRNGLVEIFPQARKADRLMLGRDMPLLDPETLVALSHAALGSKFDPLLLSQALEEVEEWHAQPYVALLDHLRSLPRVRASVLFFPAVGRDQDAASSTPKNSEGAETTRYSSSETLARVVSRGLTQPSTRSHTEWLVGVAFALDPVRYPEYGLARNPTDEEIARAVARWLSEHHNGYSTQWRQSLQQHGSVEAAVNSWTRSYLKRNSKGNHFVDRVRWAAGSSSPHTERVRQLSHRERVFLLELAEKHFSEASAPRYRFECWLFAWLRAVKEILHYHNSWVPPGRHFGDRGSKVRVEIASKWMEGWPYGQGRAKSRGGEGKSLYVQYRAILAREDLMTWAAPYVNPSHRTGGKAGNDVRSHATRYWVICPDPVVCAEDLPVSPGDLKRAIKGMKGPYNRDITLDEAYHALHVLEGGIDLRARYGRSVATRIRGYGNILRERLARLGEAHSGGDRTVEKAEPMVVSEVPRKVMSPPVILPVSEAA